jgi:hypothetical protein
MNLNRLTEFKHAPENALAPNEDMAEKIKRYIQEKQLDQEKMCSDPESLRFYFSEKCGERDCYKMF